MATLFTRIIEGELPGRFVWKDEHCVAFLSIGPLSTGHTLVVPRQEVDRWTEAPAELLAHLSTVAQVIGKAQLAAFGSERVGLEIAGFEVPHLHVHVWPTDSLQDFDLSRARTDVPSEEFDAALATLRAALVTQGHGEFVPQD